MGLKETAARRRVGSALRLHPFPVLAEAGMSAVVGLPKPLCWWKLR